MKTLHVNLWAGPGTGKSTIAAEIFGKLKWNKIDYPYSSDKKAVSDDSWSQPLLLLSFYLKKFINLQ